MLTQAIGDFLPAAVAVALSPIPIVAIVLVLGTPRARSSGSAFAVGWVTGLVAVSVIVVVVLGGADDPDSGSATAADWLKIGIGVLFLLMAAKQWRTRPKAGAEPATPSWMASLDSLTPFKALGLGAALSGANPKNLALTLTAAASIAQAGLDATDTAIAIAVFVAIGSVTVVGAVLAYLVAHDRVAGPLATIGGFMLANSNVIMMVLLLVLGAKLIGDGVAGLSGLRSERASSRSVVTGEPPSPRACRSRPRRAWSPPAPAGTLPRRPSTCRARRNARPPRTDRPVGCTGR